jgi:hypothetical protein
VSADAHSSIESAAKVMDVEILLIKPDADGALQGDRMCTRRYR